MLRNPGHVDTLGLVGAFGSVLVSALGFVLIKRWKAPVDLLTLVSWQLVVGGLALLPVALIVEGAPPAIDAPAALGFLWIAGVGTGLAYVCWFRGLRLMSAGSVSIIGLVNPAVGTLLGRRVRPRGVRAGPGARHGAGARRGAGRTAVRPEVQRAGRRTPGAGGGTHPFSSVRPPERE